MQKPWRRGAEKRKNVEEDEEFLTWSSCIFHQPYLNVCILSIMGFKTRLNPKRIRQGFEQFQVQYAPFTSLQVMDKNRERMKWVRTKINFDNHIITPNLTLTLEDKNSPERVIENYISNLRSKPLDFSKPLWEFHILNLKSSEAEATGVFWIHHSLGDGSSLISLLLAICRKADDSKTLPSLPKGKKRPVATVNSRGGVVWGLVSKVWKVLVVSWNTIVSVWGLLVILMTKDGESLLRRRPGVVYAPRRFAHRTVNLEDIKLVKNVMNVTINDVVLGITQAALAKYIYRKYDQEVKDMKNKCCPPKRIHLRAAVMADLRPPSEAQELIKKINMRRQVKLGNWVGFIFLPLKIERKDDCLDYIREAKAIIDRKKDSLEAKLSFYACWLISTLFGTKVVSGLIHKFWSRTTLTFSNVVGPLEEISLCGHPATYLAPTVYGVPQALVIHLHNHGNKMTFSISVDERNIPDPHQLCDDFVESLKMMIRDVAPAKNGTSLVSLRN